MSEVTGNSRAHSRAGIKRVLELPGVYALFQKLVSPSSGRQAFVDEFIPSFPGGRMLDIGCGGGWVLEHLPAGVDYVGYDLNPDYVRSAQERFGARGRFFCADITSDGAPQVEGEFDVILALGLLHHLNDAEAARLCESAHAQLKRGGVLVTLDGVYVPEQSAIARFIISRDRGRAVRTPEGYLGLVEGTFAEVRRQTRTDLLRIPYTHFIMHCVKG